MAEREADQHAGGQRQPQRLPEQGADFGEARAAVALGHERREPEHEPEQADERERPDRAAHRDRREDAGIEVARQHRVDHRHADRGELAQHDRQREPEALPGLAPKARPSRPGRRRRGLGLHGFRAGGARAAMRLSAGARTAYVSPLLHGAHAR
jgi:hypothetical protein